mmetsp:Transcript_19527/g.56949  ORF Transcript_19527/g.56949 Transcript_19527/m.56949 type:complete len:372 (+) Transcript_19527:675-1790(+)
MRVRCRRWIRPRERVRARCSLSQLCAELELEGEDQEEQKEPLGLPGRGAKGGDAQSPPVPEDAQSPTSPAQSRAVPRSVEAKAEAQSKREARMLERQRSTVDRRRVAQEQRQSRAEERHKRKTEADIEKQLRREQARLAREAAQQNTQKQGSPRGVATNQDQTDREEDEDDHNEEQRRGGSARGGADKIADRDDSKGKEAPIAPAATSPLDLVIDFVWENQRWYPNGRRSSSGRRRRGSSGDSTGGGGSSHGEATADIGARRRSTPLSSASRFPFPFFTGASSSSQVGCSDPEDSERGAWMPSLQGKQPFSCRKILAQPQPCRHPKFSNIEARDCLRGRGCVRRPISWLFCRHPCSPAARTRAPCSPRRQG